MLFQTKINLQKQKNILTKVVISFTIILSVIGIFLPNIASFALALPESEQIKLVLPQGGPGSTPVESPPDVNPDFLKPLRADLPADKTMDRLNIVFVFSDEIPDAELADYTNFIQNTIDKTQVPNSTTERGFLQTEPIRSNRNRINLWKYTQKMSEFNYSNFRNQTNSYNNLLKIKYIVPIFVQPEVLVFNPLNPYNGRSNAYKSTVDYSLDYKIMKFWPGIVNNLYLLEKTGSTFDKSNMSTLNHELGHAIFNLSDEYSEAGRTVPRTNYPNCAPNIATARTWWGDLEGKTDPYLKEILEITQTRNKFESSPYYDPIGFTYEKYISENLSENKVGYYPGGCFTSTEAGQMRSQPNSIMSNSYVNHYFGLVNTREINKVFALFSGTTQVVSKTLPESTKITNFQNFDENIFEKVDCQTIQLDSGKKSLHCDFVTKPNRSLSESPEFTLNWEDIDDNLERKPLVLAQSRCKVQSNVVKCEDMEISTLDFSTKANLSWKFGENYNLLNTTKQLTGEYYTYNTLDNFPTIDKAKPAIKITDPYTCGGKITGNVTDNLGFTNIKSVTVQLTKSGETTPKYTFNPVIDALGNYSIAVQQINRNDTTTFVEAGEYKVTYFATDKSDNVSDSGSYTANIKSKENCEVKPAPTPAQTPTPAPKVAATSPFATSVLVRSGGFQILNLILLTVFLSIIGFFVHRKNLK